MDADAEIAIAAIEVALADLAAGIDEALDRHSVRIEIARLVAEKAAIEAMIEGGAR